MKNEYEIRGDLTAIFLNSPKYGLLETLISTSHLERAKEFKNTWYAAYEQKTKSFYVHGEPTNRDSLVPKGRRPKHGQPNAIQVPQVRKRVHENRI